jgi:uncharacterized protein YceK
MLKILAWIIRQLVSVACIVLLCSGCASRITGTHAVSVDEALASYDWEHHTEAEFWASHPGLIETYNTEIK